MPDNILQSWLKLVSSKRFRTKTKILLFIVKIQDWNCSHHVLDSSLGKQEHGADSSQKKH